MLMALIAMVSFLYIAHAQMAEKGWEKTITLPSGEVILDISGEWDVVYEYYGMFSGFAPDSVILTITQEGNTFTAVKQIGSRLLGKGSESIKGILDKDGFKEGHLCRVAGWGFVWVPCTWEISENGNKVVLDDGRVIQGTLTRR